MRIWPLAECFGATGVDFGEYSLMQYRYAKDFYRIVQEDLAKEEK